MKIPAVCLSVILLAPAAAFADAVTMWNANAAKAALAACIAPGDDPLHEGRMYAMMHIAIHDALNAIDRRSRPYAYDAHAAAGISTDATVASAARDVMVPVIQQIPFPAPCLDAGVASVEADYTAALAAIPDGPAKTQGILLGRAAAAAILTLRAHDGSDTPLQDFDYPQGTEPGEWRFTPGVPFAFAPGWGNVTPFALTHSAQFRPRPPYDTSSKKYAADFNEIKVLGGDDITTPSTRTADQTELGLFWRESSPLQWNRIARTVSAGEGLDLWENARLFGLLNIAMADGYIGSWEAKYHYNYWRPVTAIQTADTDGNPLTEADPTWTPLQLTYPIPDYDSGHATEGGAGAEALKQFFGRDDIAFSVCSFTLPGSSCNDATPVFRSFSSFTEAANENAFSRIAIGIHFRLAVEEGTEHGRKVARLAANRVLKPVR